MIVCELCVNKPNKHRVVTENVGGEYYIHRFNLEYKPTDLVDNNKIYGKFLNNLLKKVNEITNTEYKDNWLDWKAHLFDDKCNHLGCIEKINPMLLN